MPSVDHVEDYGRFFGERRVGVSPIEALLRRCNQRIDGLLFPISKVRKGLAAVAQDLFRQISVNVSDI